MDSGFLSNVRDWLAEYSKIQLPYYNVWAKEGEMYMCLDDVVHFCV